MTNQCFSITKFGHDSPIKGRFSLDKYPITISAEVVSENSLQVRKGKYKVISNEQFPDCVSLHKENIRLASVAEQWFQWRNNYVTDTGESYKWGCNQSLNPIIYMVSFPFQMCLIHTLLDVIFVNISSQLSMLTN